MLRASLIWRLAYRTLQHNRSYSLALLAIIALISCLMTVVTISFVTRDPIVAFPREAVFPAANASLEYQPQLNEQKEKGLEYFTAQGDRKTQIAQGAHPFNPDDTKTGSIVGSSHLEPTLFISGSLSGRQGTTSPPQQTKAISGLVADWTSLDPKSETAILGRNPKETGEIALEKNLARQLNLAIGDDIAASSLCSANSCLKDRSYKVVGVFVAPHSNWQQLRLGKADKQEIMDFQGTVSTQSPLKGTWIFSDLNRDENKYPYFIYSYQVLSNTDFSTEVRKELNQAHLRVIRAEDRPFWDYKAISFGYRVALFLAPLAIYLLLIMVFSVPVMRGTLTKQSGDLEVLERLGAPPATTARVIGVQGILLGWIGVSVGVIVGYALQQIVISPNTGAPHIVHFFLVLEAVLGITVCVLTLFGVHKKLQKAVARSDK